MKTIVYFEKLIIAIMGLALITVYVLAFMTFSHYGYWPENGNPESWSSWPLNKVGNIFSLLFLVFFISPIMISLGIFSTILKIIMSKIRGDKMGVSHLLHRKIINQTDEIFDAIIPQTGKISDEKEIIEEFLAISNLKKPPGKKTTFPGPLPKSLYITGIVVNNEALLGTTIKELK